MAELRVQGLSLLVARSPAAGIGRCSSAARSDGSGLRGGVSGCNGCNGCSGCDVSPNDEADFDVDEAEQNKWYDVDGGGEPGGVGRQGPWCVEVGKAVVFFAIGLNLVGRLID